RNDRRVRNRYQRPCHPAHINRIGPVKPPEIEFCRLCGACDLPVIVDAVAYPTKTELRDGFLTARRGLPPHVHDAEAHALCGHLPALTAGGQTVGAYVPVGSGPASIALIDSLVCGGGRVLLPIPRHDAAGLPMPLRWGEYRPGRLVDARYGL